MNRLRDCAARGLLRITFRVQNAQQALCHSLFIFSHILTDREVVTRRRCRVRRVVTVGSASELRLLHTDVVRVDAHCSVSLKKIGTSISSFIPSGLDDGVERTGGTSARNCMANLRSQTFKSYTYTPSQGIVIGVDHDFTIL